MNPYCTYFDRGYLAQGVALWTSLARHDADAQLWALALDDETAGVLRGLNDSRLKVLTLPDLLNTDPELAAVQRTRSRQEFIFTLTPCLTRHLLAGMKFGATLCYLDADLLFFESPAPIWRALDSGSILVVQHRYPKWHDDSGLYGRFNVGVLGFRNDANGR
ncbi:MAG: hypothetical protein JWM35_2635, partial [Verrucomicrobia bacterium]|nr:hypothetical protein [Verrucomicrobiota bacterium]